MYLMLKKDYVNLEKYQEATVLEKIRGLSLSEDSDFLLLRLAF